MCYAQGSVALESAVCPMCKINIYVYRQDPSRPCPHVRGICNNLRNHPGNAVVVHLRNAEWPRLNGCGFCKWAFVNPGASLRSLYSNRGWAGCCKAPEPSEIPTIPESEQSLITCLHGTVFPPRGRFRDAPPSHADARRSSSSEPRTAAYMEPRSSSQPESRSTRYPGAPALRIGHQRGSSSSPTDRTGSHAGYSPVEMTARRRSPSPERDETPSPPPQSRTRRSGSLSAQYVSPRPVYPYVLSNRSPADSLSTNKKGEPARERRSNVQESQPVNYAHNRQRSLDASAVMRTPARSSSPKRGVPDYETARRTAPEPLPSYRGNSPSRAPDPPTKNGVGTTSRSSRRLTIPVPSAPVQPPMARRHTEENSSRGLALPTDIKPASRASPQPGLYQPRTSSPLSYTLPTTNATRRRPSIVEPSGPARGNMSDTSSESSSNSASSGEEFSGQFSGLRLSNSPGSRESVTTATSDGFTDYLSEESEAEIQREAEQRAIEIQTNRIEERELRDANSKLQGLELQPPPQWTGYSSTARYTPPYRNGPSPSHQAKGPPYGPPQSMSQPPQHSGQNWASTRQQTLTAHNLGTALGGDARAAGGWTRLPNGAPADQHRYSTSPSRAAS
ncbi:hypothetical protein BOTBODRAFT_50693 [Botryobasidium botryosum FD-172 SS1]|uniref:Uncharacterized protein n=1 Tax=Botryobasidium botryosum (strain FD-172 SS1) TaxID=930990 RepID=A0A067N9Z7_BOTB1|nr:hypothetical protein BOTBODRAFT_50693 [Botryobasidium botryosum FD-172 SS1]